MTVIQLDNSVNSSRKLSSSLEDLNEISSQFCANDLDHRIILNAYKTRLQQISETLAEAEYTGLWDLISIFIEGVEALVESGRELNNDECRFLLNFPNLMVEYLSLPLSKIPGKLLIRFFKNPNWVRPISESEETILTDLIYPHHEAIDDLTSELTQPAAVAETDNIITSDSTSTIDLSAIDNSAEVTDTELSTEVDLNFFDHESVTAQDEISLTDFNQNVFHLHDHTSSSDVDESDLEDSAVIEPDISLASVSEEINLLDLCETAETTDENITPESESSVNLDDIIAGSRPLTATVSVAEEMTSQAMITEVFSEEEASQKPSYSNNDILTDESEQVQFSIDENQQMLVDLVRSELAEIIDSRDHDISELKNAEDTDHRKNHLLHYSEQAENISNAVELIGLEGLSQCSHFFAVNIKQMANLASQLTDSHYYLLYEWPVKLLAYLQNIKKPANCDFLVEFMSLASWPEAVEKDQSAVLIKLLENPVFEQEEQIQRQVVASADDVSIEVPEDVNHELLDGLLQDLPSQTEEFSTAILNLKNGGNRSDIIVAQRIAHTLKGAANVVGVRGIASLTHHLEDILEYLSKNNKFPTPALMEVLINASDCLESITESLLGIDAPPDNAVSVLQSILDWANILDQTGLPDNDTDIMITQKHEIPADIDARNVNDDEQKSEAPVTQTNSHSENVLRISVNLADELLRLAGENLISTTQIEDKINNTIKRQEAATVHSSNLQQVSFDLEHLIDIQGITTNFTHAQDDSDFDTLEMDKFHELHSVSRRLIEITADSMQMSKALKTELLELKNLVIYQNKIQKDNQELVLRTRMVPVKSVVARLKRGVRQACRLTGKTVELNITDNDTYMDSDVLNEMIEPLMHLIRNAVDHGIENVETRHQRAKDTSGQIQLSFNRKGDQVVIVIADDGKGLDPELIYKKAITKGLINHNQELTTDAIYRLILEPGFSTRDEVTQTSGRGIGLDVVNSKLRQLKGSINIQSVTGKGSVFELTLPISSFSTHSLLVRVRQYIYAISNRGIEEVLYPGTGELREVGSQLIYQLDDEIYDTHLIDGLLNLPPDRRKIERDMRPVLLVKDDSGERRAILVQEVIDSRDVVVKAMGQYMPKIRGTIGATILGDGSIAPVIDLPELLRESTNYQHQPLTSVDTSANANNRRVPYVLVVDDSLSARRSLTQFAEDMGFNVRSARDGMEAVSIIQARIPDLVLVDMEMPRMNGLELTAHIRANEKSRDVPVIMITSRSSDKHRSSAIEKGVNHFMVKPFDEDLLAAHINEAVGIAV